MIFLQPGRMVRFLKTAFYEHWNDIEERALRFVEESIELAETDGVTREQCHALVDQVFDKGEPGNSYQEVGGVMVTLAAYMALKNIDAGRAFEEELSRVEQPEVIAKIRAKHKTKAVVSSKWRK